MSQWTGDFAHHSTTANETLDYSVAQRIAEQAATLFEQRLAQFVFFNEDTGVPETYQPNDENREYLVSLYIAFLGKRFGIVTS